MSFLLNNLLHFGRLLHSLGLHVHAGRMMDVASALEHIDVRRKSDFYFALRSILIHRQQDLALFDEAFRLFWHQPPGEPAKEGARAEEESRPRSVPPGDAPSDDPPAADDPSDLDATNTAGSIDPLSYGQREVSRAKDFAQFTEDELDQAKAMLATLEWDVGTRRTRRWESGEGATIDMRRIVRRNMRYGGEPVILPTRQRLLKPRRLVLICDVSGSMERYSRMLLHFVHSLAGDWGRLSRVEAFLFATRLTRITRAIRRRAAAEDILGVPRQMSDWGGGTRMGDALRMFNIQWGRRVLGHGPVVLLISDGWDRGSPDVLRREMARLQRSCHRLIWLNPLLGSAGYQPLTRGMQAALPFVDDFLPVHNLVSLEALAEHLNALPKVKSGKQSRK